MTVARAGPTSTIRAKNSKERQRGAHQGQNATTDAITSPETCLGRLVKASGA